MNKISKLWCHFGMMYLNAVESGNIRFLTIYTIVGYAFGLACYWAVGLMTGGIANAFLILAGIALATTAVSAVVKLCQFHRVGVAAVEIVNIVLTIIVFIGVWLTPTFLGVALWQAFFTVGYALAQKKTLHAVAEASQSRA